MSEGPVEVYKEICDGKALWIGGLFSQDKRQGERLQSK
jgi:hypothetical protein